MDLNNFHYVISGKKGAPWIIFLHGLLGSAANWRRIASAFEVDFQILAFDQRGHGRSFKPAQGYEPRDFARDLAFIMDELKIAQAVLVGHSMGGRNALNFAYLYPERVLKLAIEDIGPEASVVNGRDLIVKLEKVPVPFSDKRLAKEYLLNEFKDPKLGNFLYTNIVSAQSSEGANAGAASGPWVWAFNLTNIIEIIEKGRGKNQWHEYENIRCPILVIRGENSEELSREEFKKMLAKNSHATEVEVKGTGHWVHFEKADEFIEVLKKFIHEK